MSTQFQDTLSLAMNYVRMTWRFRWLALVLAGVVSMVGWVYVMTLPNQYSVSARVYLDTDSILRPLLRGLAVDGNQELQAVNLISRTLLVRPNLEAVARKTDMDLNVTTPAQFEALINGLAKDIKVNRTRSTNIFRIAYASTEPKLAYRVVEALLNIFVEKSLGESRKDSSSSRQFIEDQIKEYEARLVAAEARLKDFKRKNVGMMPSDGRTYYSRLESAVAQLRQAMLEKEEAVRRVAAIEEGLKGVPASFRPDALPGAKSPEQLAVESVQARIEAIEKSTDNMLLQYTERHPDVVAARRLVAALKQEHESALSALAARGSGAADSDPRRAIPNPLYQELTLELGSAQAEVAAMDARVQEYEKRQEALKKLVDTIPKVEAELVRLNRDYGIDKKNYDQLVSRRESLKISEDATQNTDGVRFNVIEPPREPLLPTGPDRLTMSSMALAGGLAVGIGLAFLIGLTKPAFYTTTDIETATRLPVLGIVSRIWTRREMFRRRMEVATFAVGFVALLGVFSGILTLHTRYVDVLAEFDVKGRLEQVKGMLK